MKAAVFASGGGTNFEALMEKQEQSLLDVEIVGLVADKENAYARTRADNHHIPQRWFNPKAYAGKAPYETAVKQWLDELGVEMIILSGYMRYIGEVLLDAYPEKIVNLHPAWLPEFPGAHGIADAYHAGVSQTGVTVHYVDAGVDTGPVILQERVPIDPEWTLEQLETAVHNKEYDLFWRGVNKAAAEIEKRNK